MIVPRVHTVRLPFLIRWSREDLEKEAAELAGRVAILEDLVETGLVSPDDPDLVRGLVAYKTSLGEVNRRRLDFLDVDP